MPTQTSTPDAETPLGPQTTPGLPDRKQDGPVSPPISDRGDTKNPNDPAPLNPALLPIGDPASMA